MVKNLPTIQETNPWVGISAPGGHGNLLQYSGLENHNGQSTLAGYSPWGHIVGHN